MKKILLMLTAVGTLLTACNNDCDHTDYDHSADLVGTWTCLQADFAEALVIAADGSVVSTGVAFGEYWENVKGNIVVKDGEVTMTFEDHDNYQGHFDIIPGMAFSVYNDKGRRFTYNYCKEDLADEVVGMWVCTQSTAIEGEMAVNTYQKDGKALFTGFVPDANGYMPNLESTYKVVGDLLIQSYYVNNDESQHLSFRLNYSPNATTMGDILTITSIMSFDDQVIESYSSLLRIKQNLDLAGKKYDYIKTFVSNVDGLDKDIDFMGFELNFAKMDGVRLDKMLKHLLFAVEFPDAETIKYSCYYNGESMSMEAPIVVEGNKMTVKMSEKNAAYRDIDLYTFQDADCSQMHMYMPTYAFINFFGNMQATIMSQLGQLDLTDAEAVKAVFDSIDEAVNTINVSFVMTSSK